MVRTLRCRSDRRHWLRERSGDGVRNEIRSNARRRRRGLLPGTFGRIVRDGVCVARPGTRLASCRSLAKLGKDPEAWGVDHRLRSASELI